MQFGTDEFMQFCRKMNIEPYFCANCGDGDMRERPMVEYCNGTGDSALVKLRRHTVLTHRTRLNMGYRQWIDGPWQIGYKTPQEYARAVTEFSKVMKWVDPTIKLVAAAVSIWEDYPFPDHIGIKTEWVERTSWCWTGGDRIDYMALHRTLTCTMTLRSKHLWPLPRILISTWTAYEGLIRSVCLERVSVTCQHRHRWMGRDALPNREDRVISIIWRALVVALHLNVLSACALCKIGTLLDDDRYRYYYPDWHVSISRWCWIPFSIPLNFTVAPADNYHWMYSTAAILSPARIWDALTMVFARWMWRRPGWSRKQLVVFVVNQSKDRRWKPAFRWPAANFNGNIASVINGPGIKSETPGKTLTR